MSLLVVWLPERPRSAAAREAPTTGTDAPVRWVLSPDGRQPGREGLSRLDALPAARRLVAVCPPRELAWHRVTVPRAPAAKRQAALLSVLEERLLDDPALVHLALAADAQPGQLAWVAALHRPWLLAWLQAFAAANRRLDALVPLMAPRSRPAVHVWDPAEPASPAAGQALPRGGLQHPQAWALAMDETEAHCLPLAGLGATRRLMPWRTAPRVRLSASPALQAQATRYFRRRVRAVDDGRVALAAARRRWQLLQFDLAPQAGRWSAAGQGLWRPAWRPAVWALLGLLLVNALGLNLHAQRVATTLQDRRDAMAQLLRDSHPGVRAVLDAPVQMRQENERLRQGVGPLPGADLAAVLRLMAEAWPAGVPAPLAWHYQRERLMLPESTLLPEQAQALRQRLAASGWTLERMEGQWAVGPPLASTLTLGERP